MSKSNVPAKGLIPTSPMRYWARGIDPSFDNTPTQNRRVYVAKMVIDLIKSGDVKVRRGDYIKSDKLDKDLRQMQTRTNFKTFLSPDKDIEACVCGLLFIADTLVRGRCFINPGARLVNINHQKMMARLNYFTDRQVKIMEAAFEVVWAFSEDDRIGTQAIIFGTKFQNPEKRLIAIMENLIANNGEFKPA